MNTKSKKTFSERNTKSKSQLLIIAEHAGNEIPVELRNLGLNKNDLRRHISHDIGVYGVCEFLSKKVKDQIILSKFCLYRTNGISYIVSTSGDSNT